MTPARMQELTQVALEVAEEAAALVHSVYRTEIAPTEKRTADLVTEYDVMSERLIRKRLGELTPDLRVVGEEEGGEPSGPTWYCDPIDGTTNFVHGHPFFCVSIGLIEDGDALLGAVVAPALRLRWHGFVGGGAVREGKPCHVSGTRALADSLLATGFYPGMLAKGPDSNLDSFARMLPKTRGIRRCGSAALDLCMVADGTYDAYWERALNAWDCAAGAAIVRAAGGRVTDLRGEPANLAVGHIVASNGHIHDELLGLL